MKKTALKILVFPFAQLHPSDDALAEMERIHQGGIDGAFALFVNLLRWVGAIIFFAIILAVGMSS